MSDKMKVLIAYDGSSGADAALDDVQRAGLPRMAEAPIMSVADVFLPPPSSPAPDVPAQVLMAVQRARALAADAMEEAHTLALQARTRVLTSFPAWAVITMAETWQPDVVVVGSHGRSAMGRVLLGSVSHKVLTEAPCSVRVGRRPHQTDEAPLPLLIGVDGSPDAEAAVHAVAMRAWPVGSATRLVTALDARMCTALAFMGLPRESGAEARDEDETAQMSDMVEALAAPLRTRGLTVSSVITEGDPKHVLLDEAEHWGADCIFVGARGLSR